MRQISPLQSKMPYAYDTESYVLRMHTVPYLSLEILRNPLSSVPKFDLQLCKLLLLPARPFGEWKDR